MESRDVLYMAKVSYFFWFLLQEAYFVFYMGMFLLLYMIGTASLGLNQFISHRLCFLALDQKGPKEPLKGTHK